MAVCAAVAAATFTGGLAWASIPDSSGTIHGCVMQATGVLRVVNSASDCTPAETAITWNQAGPQGPAGQPGPAGPQGPVGPPGTGNAAGTLATTYNGPSLTANTWTDIQTQTLTITGNDNHKVFVSGQFTGYYGNNGSTYELVRGLVDGSQVDGDGNGQAMQPVSGPGLATVPMSFIVTVAPGTHSFTMQGKAFNSLGVAERDFSVMDLGACGC